MRELFEQHPALIFGGVFVFFIILLVLIVVWRSVQAKKARQASIRQWAFRNGFDFAEGPMPAYDLAPIDHLQKSDTVTLAEARNILRGSRGTLFDLHSTTEWHSGHDLTVTSKWMSCAIFKLVHPPPRLTLSVLAGGDAGSFESKVLGGIVNIAQSLGAGKLGDMIVIEGRPGILLRSKERERVEALFAGERAKFFDDKRGWSVETQESWLFVMCDPSMAGEGWKKGALVDAADFDQFMNVAQSIAQFFDRDDHDHFFHSSS